MRKLLIRPMLATDWRAVAKIYREGIATGQATFETSVPTYALWNKAHLPICRLVAITENTVTGWAALSPVSHRTVYRGVAEVSLYISTTYRGKGIATSLMSFLIKESEKEGIWTLQSSIFPSNTASIHLHEKAGFRKIGYRERVGKLHGIWHDNLLFEKRSLLVEPA